MADGVFYLSLNAAQLSLCLEICDYNSPHVTATVFELLYFPFITLRVFVKFFENLWPTFQQFELGETLPLIHTSFVILCLTYMYVFCFAFHNPKNLGYYIYLEDYFWAVKILPILYGFSFYAINRVNNRTLRVWGTGSHVRRKYTAIL